MKTYVLIVSRQFPKTHKRAGEQTFFVEKIYSAFKSLVPCEHCFRSSSCKIIGGKNCMVDAMEFVHKLHTIRANYELWKKREKEINEGKAILSIRYWSEKPYRSKQVEICQLTKIGVQELELTYYGKWRIDNIFSDYTMEDFSKNDGLSLDDFLEWFKNYDFSKSMAIIQFTDFRY
jgi:hypothetical protein